MKYLFLLIAVFYVYRIFRFLFLINNTRQECLKGNNTPKKITWIIPIFGIDDDVILNVPNIIDITTKANFIKTIFCVSWRTPEVFKLIESEIKKSSSTNIDVILSPKNTQVSDKNNNLITGLNVIDTQRVLMTDIDNILGVDIIKKISLSLDNYPAITSYSFYIDSLVRMIWWSSDIEDFLSSKTIYFWGGAISLNFNQISKDKVIQIFTNNIHDDLPLTKYIKSKYNLHFLKFAMGQSLGKNHPESTISWSIRLATFGKFGLGKLWFIWLLGHIIRLLSLGLLISNFCQFTIVFYLISIHYFLKGLYSLFLSKSSPKKTLQTAAILSKLFIGSQLMVLYEPTINIIAFFKQDLKYREIKYKMNKPSP